MLRAGDRSLPKALARKVRVVKRTVGRPTTLRSSLPGLGERSRVVHLIVEGSSSPSVLFVDWRFPQSWTEDLYKEAFPGKADTLSFRTLFRLCTIKTRVKEDLRQSNLEFGVLYNLV